LIQDEQLVAADTHSLSSSLEEDFEAAKEHFEPKKPTYILFRLDTQNSLGHEWTLLSYVPDGSPVKQRMLYASTRDTLKQQLGKSYFAPDMHGSSIDDFTWEAFLGRSEKEVSDVLLTASEVQLKHEITAEIDPGHTREYVHSVKFPLSKDASKALSSLGEKKNFVQLLVDARHETVELETAKHIKPRELAENVSPTEPRFTFFRYRHTFAGEAIDSNVFIYSCPDASSVKLRMLYSTVKSVLTAAAEDAGISLERGAKVEISDPSELTEEFLNETLHPKKEVKQGFARPMRPGKGKPRLTSRVRSDK